MKILDRKRKKIVLGISGGIASYKAIELIRELQKKGYINIETILTENGSKFVTPITFEAITGNKPYLDVFEQDRALSHIKVVEDADVFAIVPATANTIAKMATGIADNFLTTAYLACNAKVLVAPSMNEIMYLSKPVMRNIKILKDDGAIVLEPVEGYLACGLVGKGRLTDPKTIADYIDFYSFRKKEGLLFGKKILITSGGTEEEIDPVRTVTNRSTGKMGKAMAEIFSLLGADVQIIAARSEVAYPEYCKIVNVKTAQEMKEVVFECADDFDCVVMAAAVSDFTPSQSSSIKIKKTEGTDSLVMSFKKTYDILQGLGNKYGNMKIIVGFAAETDNIVENALIKVDKKNVAFIVANQVGTKNSGFGTDESTAFIVGKNKKVEELGQLSKQDIAIKIALKISEELNN